MRGVPEDCVHVDQIDDARLDIGRRINAYDDVGADGEAAGLREAIRILEDHGVL